MRVRIDRILFPEPVTAGLNLEVLVILSSMMRKTNEDPEPVELQVEGDYYRIVDGRHRVIAAMMAGRKDVLTKTEVA